MTESSSDAPSADQLLPQGFEPWLLELLREHPKGIDEYRLIRALAEQFPESLFALPGALREPLQLFQLHFLLFHALYRLSDRLSAEGFELRVHALGIRLQLRAAGEEGVALTDPLRAYYLDWDQWLQTRDEDVRRLLDDFMRGAGSLDADELQQALGLFDLPAQATGAQLRQRYRQLVSRHHPDRGGDTAMLQRINRAWEVLQRHAGRA